ncbi:hypothetical protein HDR60_03815 [bacterium]|nr:hypothetical protein [bacterium]
MFKLFRKNKEKYFPFLPVELNNEKRCFAKSNQFEDEIFKKCKNLYERTEELNQEMREFVRKCGELSFAQSMELSINDEISFVPDEKFEEKLEAILKKGQQIKEDAIIISESIVYDVVNCSKNES